METTAIEPLHIAAASGHPPSPLLNRTRGPRDNETEAQRIKREKAAERQRRKRKRDRENMEKMRGSFEDDDPISTVTNTANNNNNLNVNAPNPVAPTTATTVAVAQHMIVSQQQQQQQPENTLPHNLPPTPFQQAAMRRKTLPTNPNSKHRSASSSSNTKHMESEYELTPQEMERRDKIRAAARERQRKHRQLVKQRRLQELSVEMGNHGGVDDSHSQYAIADAMVSSAQAPQPQHLRQPIPRPPPTIDQPQLPPLSAPHGGQTFASLLLLSFSLSPLLKQHLLTTLSLSNDELASLEPVLADAYDQWDQRRRNCTNPATSPSLTNAQIMAAPPPNFNTDATHDFRARFARSIQAQPPYRVDTTVTNPVNADPNSHMAPPPTAAQAQVQVQSQVQVKAEVPGHGLGGS